MQILKIVCWSLLVVVFGCFYCVQLPAQTVTFSPETIHSLAERWNWAKQEAGKTSANHSYWIGYSFVKMMGVNSFTGSFYSDTRRNKPSLCEELGLKPCIEEEETSGPVHKMRMNDGSTIIDSGDEDHRQVPKDLGILFEIDEDAKESAGIVNVVVSNLSLHVDLAGEPVFWLGEAKVDESSQFLQSMYDTKASKKIQQHIVSAVGQHPPAEPVIEFLSSILKNGEYTQVRKDAAFWLGQTNSDAALKILVETAQNDRSSEVKEDCIFAISEMDGEKGVEPLILLAQKSPDREIRKKAMFWLGQKASKKATAALVKFASDNDDSQIQKSAVFALTQLPNDEGIDPLITIAKTHSNPTVRKEAIFWLGENGSEKALNALIEILHK